MDKINELNLNEWEKIINGQVIIVFYTKWCPICKMLLFKLEEIFEEIDIAIYKIDASSLNEKISDVNKMAVPQVILYQNSHMIKKYQGMLDEDEFDEIINAINKKNF